VTSKMGLAMRRLLEGYGRKKRRAGVKLAARTVAASLSAHTAQLAGPLLRIRRSGSPRQRTCGQGEERTCAPS